VSSTLGRFIASVCLRLGISPEYFYELGLQAMVRRDYRRAAWAYRLSTIIDPGLVEGWYSWAMANTDRGNFHVAIEGYSKGLHIEPNDASALVSRSNLYRWTGDLQRAAADLDEAVRLDPESPVHLEARGCFLLDQRKFDLAIEDFTEALKSDPRYATAYLYRGLAYHCLGKYEQAIADYTSAIEVEARYVFSLAVSGFVSPKQKKSGQMAIIPQRLGFNIRSEPCYATAFFNRGLARYDRAEHQLALDDFKMAAAYDPTYLNPPDRRP
jgi:tetratricopeptide (TPR) repeat protein